MVFWGNRDDWVIGSAGNYVIGNYLKILADDLIAFFLSWALHRPGSIPLARV
jgi:hypothetical protein